MEGNVEPLRLNWSDDTGSARALLERILAERLDLVQADSTDPTALARLERLGFPTVMTEGYQIWRHPQVDSATDESTFASGDSPEGHVRVALGNTALMQSLSSRRFEPGPVVHSCQLQPYLSLSRFPVLERAFQVSDADISSYAEQSGDLNPLHFDDSFARSQGFKGHIAHGMIFSGWFSRFLGTDHPGPGTIYLRSISVFLAPVYPGIAYNVRISTPLHDAAKGTFRVVAQLLDPSGSHCLIAYSDVMKRNSSG